MMLLIITFASLIVLLAGDKCVHFYSFDDNYTRHFDSRSCGGDEPWGVVEYDSIGVTLPGNSATGLITSTASCISSFPNEYSAGAVLKFLVYSTIECVTHVSIHNNEDDIVMASSIYRPDGYERPDIVWKEIAIALKETFSGFIRLRGSCKHEKNYILVDSIKYSLGQTSADCQKSNSKNVVLEDEDASEFILYIENDDLFDLIREDGSGDGGAEVDIEEGTGTPWNPFTIALTVIGAAFGLALVAYGAYYYGQNRAINDVERFLVEHLEASTESTITLPRARPALRID